MKKILLIIGTMAVVVSSCKKKDDQTTTVSTPPYQIGQPVTPGDISGTVKGTMTTGNTYTVTADITVNKGDTLLLQKGVTVCVKKGFSVIVKGVLISLGTQDKPNSFTCCDAPAKVNSITPPASDPAFNGGQGWWTGINCDTSCTLLVLKWTHVDYTGAAFSTTENFVGGKSGGTSFGILFQNPNGDFIMEDSWMYGGIDDAIRIQQGRISLMRNTYEKMGYVGGDCLNAKSGTIGDMAYNLFVGTATNGTKAANKGNFTYCTINMYNNTYINGGYRQAQTGRGGDINYEQGANGKAYNNLIVNCKYGFRIVNNPIADTSNCQYGYNFGYGDSASVANQFYPTNGAITRPSAYVVPVPSSTGYVYNHTAATPYDASALVKKNNPTFAGFPLPETGIQHLSDINYVGSYNFKLQSGSPALGIGYTNFSALNATKISNPNYKAIITPPGSDMGCYQSNGNGNQH